MLSSKPGPSSRCTSIAAPMTCRESKLACSKRGCISSLPSPPLLPLLPSVHLPCLLTIKLYRLHDLAQVVGNGDGAVGETGAADAAAAEDFVELLLVGGVIGDGSGGVFELVAGEDADDPLVGADDSLIAKEPGTGDASGAGRLAAEAAGG